MWSHGGLVAGAMEFPGKGAHAFAVFKVTEDYAARHPELGLHVGEIVVFDNAVGGLIRGADVDDWVRLAGAGVGEVHGIVFGADGKPDLPLDGDGPSGRGPVGPIGARPDRHLRPVSDPGSNPSPTRHPNPNLRSWGRSCWSCAAS